MARVSDFELERLKREVSVQRLVEAAGVELQRHGKDFVGRCVFHEDKTPSLVISPEKNLWHCLGACRTGGSVVDWVMRLNGVSFRHAVELLRADVAAAPAPAGRTPAKHSTVRHLPAPVTHSADDQALMKQVVDYYHQQLKESPEALAYLKKRGLESAELVDHFKLGFANRTLGLRLPVKETKAGGEIRARLQRLGVLRESGHEHFNGSVVVPIITAQGDVVGMYGRKVTPTLRTGTPLHLYLPGPHRGVFNEEELPRHKTVILCEALIDALTFWAAGFRNVTCAYGVEGFTELHLEALKDGGVATVLIAYDRDEAGDGAAEALAPKLIKEGFECFRVQFPRGMDANEYALKVQPAAKSLGAALRAAVWMGKGQKTTAPELAAQPKVSAVAANASSLAASSSIGAVATRGVEIHTTATATTAAATAAAVNAAAASGPQTPPAAAPRATPASTPPPPTIEASHEDEVTLTFGDRRYRARGLSKNTAYDSLKVNLLVAKAEAFHVDTFELYSAKARAVFIRDAAAELRLEEDILKRDLGALLLELERRQDAAIRRTLEPKSKQVALSEAEREEALALLKNPDLLGRILSDFEKCGVVGEETNKLVGYLAATSRKLDEPLAVIIQSSSAAGKSSLMEAVLQLVPEEDRVKYSAMTGQSLFYMGDADLKHKVLAIVEEEGAHRASYALKLLQSEGELTIASTGKDPNTGRLVTHEYRVEGPVQLFLTTTAIELDEELLNRCVVLTVDEDRAQTRAIHQLQRESQTLDGLLKRKDKDAIVALHRNAQRLIRPLLVANPFAKSLTFLDEKTRTRRDHMKYLTLIRTLALLHQHQRPLKTVQHRGEVVEYVEVTAKDIEVANRLAHEALGRSLDELPPQTRKLLLLLDQHVTKNCEEQKVQRRDCRFSRRELREATGWGNTQLRVHLQRLVELEYVLVHHGARGQQFVYELAYDGKGKDGTSFLSGLIDAERLLSDGYDANLAGQRHQVAAPSRPQSGPNAGTVREPSSPENGSGGAGFSALAAATEENALLRGPPNGAASYPNAATAGR